MSGNTSMPLIVSSDRYAPSASSSSQRGAEDFVPSPPSASQPVAPSPLNAPPPSLLNEGQAFVEPPQLHSMPVRPVTPTLPPFMNSVVMTPSHQAPTPAGKGKSNVYIPPHAREMMKATGSEEKKDSASAPYMSMATGDATRLVEHTEELQHALECFSAYSHDLKNYIHHLESSYGKAISDLDEMAYRSDQHYCMSEKRGAELDYSHHQIGWLSSELDACQSQQRALLHSLDALQREAGDQTARLGKEADAAKFFVKHLEQKLESLSEDQETYKKDTKYLTEEVTIIADRLSSLSKESEQDKASLIQATEQRSKDNIQLKVLDLEISKLKEKIKGFRKSYASEKDNARKRDEKNMALISARDDLNRKLSNTIDLLRKKNHSERASKKGKDKKTNDDLLSQKASLERQVNEITESISSGEREKAELNTRMEEFRESVNSLEGKLKSKEDENTKLKVRLKALSSELSRRQHDAEKSQKKSKSAIEKREDQIKALTSDNRQLASIQNVRNKGISQLLETNQEIAKITDHLNRDLFVSKALRNVESLERNLVLQGHDPHVIYGNKPLQKSDPSFSVEKRNLAAIEKTRRKSHKTGDFNATLMDTGQMMRDFLGDYLKHPSVPAPSSKQLIVPSEAVDQSGNVSEAGLMKSMTDALTRTQDRVEKEVAEKEELRKQVENLKEVNNRLTARLQAKK